MQDRQSEFRGIGGRIDMLNTLIDGFIHQSQLCQTLGHFTITHPLLVPPFPTVHNAQGLIEAPPSQDALQGDITTPHVATLDMRRSVVTIPCNVTGMTGVLPQFMPPATTTPSFIDILADTARVAVGNSSSPSLPTHRESETLLADTTFPTLPTINSTDHDTIKSTPALPVLANTLDQPPSFDVPQATLASASASSLGPMGDCNDVSELPGQHSLPYDNGQQSTLPQESSSSPQPQGTIVLAPSTLSKTGTPEVSHLARPIQFTSHQTSVHTVNAFPGNINAEQDTVNTSFSPQVTPIDFPEPSHSVSGPVQTPVQGPIPLSPDFHPYPHLTTASSLRSRRALSLPASPRHVRQNLLTIQSGPVLIFTSRV